MKMSGFGGFNKMSEHDKYPYGSCMLVAEELTHKLLDSGVEDFIIVEGYITFRGVEWDEKHTWIELGNGDILDPTKTQWGIDIDKMVYLTNNRKEYTPQDYLRLCKEFPI